MVLRLAGSVNNTGDRNGRLSGGRHAVMLAPVGIDGFARGVKASRGCRHSPA